MIKKILVLFGIATLLTATSFKNLAAEGPLKISFVYISPIGDAGWSYQHEQGRLAMNKALGKQIQSSYIENIPDGPDSERVFRELAVAKNDLIIGVSFGYMNPMEKVAKEFPNQYFAHASGYKSAPNFVNYNVRFYEARYVSGYVAGKMTKSNILGYVAAFPIPEVIMGINAFTLGALKANPNVKVRVIWTSSWFDPGKEREASIALISQGVDILTHHSDSVAVAKTAEEKGVYVLPYHSDQKKYAPTQQLTAVVHEWGDFYTRLAKKVLDKKWDNTPVWSGYKEKMLGLAPLNPKVPREVRSEVVKIENSLTKGTFHPFTGPIFDQEGTQKVAAGQVMTDADLNRMNFYVKGVESKYPAKQ